MFRLQPIYAIKNDAACCANDSLWRFVEGSRSFGGKRDSFIGFVTVAASRGRVKSKIRVAVIAIQAGVRFIERLTSNRVVKFARFPIRVTSHAGSISFGKRRGDVASAATRGLMESVHRPARGRMVKRRRSTRSLGVMAAIAGVIAVAL